MTIFYDTPYQLQIFSTYPICPGLRFQQQGVRTGAARTAPTQDGALFRELAAGGASVVVVEAPQSQPLTAAAVQPGQVLQQVINDLKIIKKG